MTGKSPGHDHAGEGSSFSSAQDDYARSHEGVEGGGMRELILENAAFKGDPPMEESDTKLVILFLKDCCLRS